MEHGLVAGIHPPGSGERLPGAGRCTATRGTS
jgi:hypothetical protein